MSCPHIAKLRPELESLPSRMQTLAVDKRGYVVPWFVDYVNGEPEFRAMDKRKYVRAIRDKLCWVCGQRLGRFVSFVVGPMCGINRTSSEPPSHLECAEWSARNCPFLNNPDSIRRIDAGMPLDAPCIGGEAILRNPGVTLIWTTKDYSIFKDGQGGLLIQMGEPEHVKWYCEGGLATRAEVEKAIETGLPALINRAMQQDGAMAFLTKAVDKFSEYLPK